MSIAVTFLQNQKNLMANDSETLNKEIAVNKKRMFEKNWLWFLHWWGPKRLCSARLNSTVQCFAKLGFCEYFQDDGYFCVSFRFLVY